MADFITLTEIKYTTSLTHRNETERVFNKLLITSISEDRDNTQTFIIYNGDEITVRETLNEINIKSAE